QSLLAGAPEPCQRRRARAGDQAAGGPMSGASVHIRQGGQALAEGLVGLAAIAVLFWAIPVLGRYQDVVLQGTHASRYAAFLLTQDAFGDAVLAQRVDDEYFTKAAARWRTPAGLPLLQNAVQLSTRRDAALSLAGSG